MKSGVKRFWSSRESKVYVCELLLKEHKINGKT